MISCRRIISVTFDMVLRILRTPSAGCGDDITLEMEEALERLKSV
jgi:hypothetical protein